MPVPGGRAHVPAHRLAAHLAAAARRGRGGVVNVLLSGDASRRRAAWRSRCGSSGSPSPACCWSPSTDPVRLADALTVHWRVSTRFAYGALAALRLVPLLVAELETIRLARRARGVEAGRNPVATLRLFAGIGVRAAGRRRAPGLPAGHRRWTPAGSTPACPAPTPAGRCCAPRDAAFVVAAVVVCAAAVALGVLAGAWDPVCGG